MYQKIDAEWLDLAYGKVGHGVYGVKKQLFSLIEKNITLKGPHDEEITQDTIAKIAKSWGKDILSTGNRDIMHLVISARKGRDRNKFLNAARGFLDHEFKDHKYAFALHGPHDTIPDKHTGETKATEHVHIHVMIVMRNSRGIKLNLVPYSQSETCTV